MTTDAVTIQFIAALLQCCYMSVHKVNRSRKDFDPQQSH